MYFSLLTWSSTDVIIFQLIVAVNQEEIPRLAALLKRGLDNGVKDLSVIEADGIKEIEPNCKVCRRCNPHKDPTHAYLILRAFLCCCCPKIYTIYLLIYYLLRPSVLPKPCQNHVWLHPGMAVCCRSKEGHCDLCNLHFDLRPALKNNLVRTRLQDQETQCGRIHLWKVVCQVSKVGHTVTYLDLWSTSSYIHTDSWQFSLCHLPNVTASIVGDYGWHHNPLPCFIIFSNFGKILHFKDVNCNIVVLCE